MKTHSTLKAILMSLMLVLQVMLFSSVVLYI